MAKTFFIYDYESFGVDPKSDRPAQFAGIRTDEEFNIIGEPIVLFCKQTDDYLPSPEAVLLTGITPQQCNENGVSEPEFAAKILHEFSQPDTCIMGYNNIRYDDEMTRFTFYRNFIDPYAYSYAQGNSRWDLLDVVRACYALRPEGIQWPLDEQGMPSFKLERLTQANGLSHEKAHDAMSDVYATIEMAKLIRAKQPKLFDFFFQHRDKRSLSAMIDYLNLTPLVHVSGMLGNYRGNTAWMVPIIPHPTNANAVVMCDLAGDLQPFLDTPAEILHQRLYSKKSALQEEGVPAVPLKLVHLNKCPILAPAKTLLPENSARLGIDREKCLQNLNILRQNAITIRDKISALYEIDSQKSYEADSDVETQLYANFFSPNDRANMEILRSLPPEKLAEHGLSFEDARIAPLLFHYRARHFFKTLERKDQIRWKKHCQQKLAKQLQAMDFEQTMQTLFQRYYDQPEKTALLQAVYSYAERLFN